MKNLRVLIIVFALGQTNSAFANIGGHKPPPRATTSTQIPSAETQSIRYWLL